MDVLLVQWSALGLSISYHVQYHVQINRGVRSRKRLIKKRRKKNGVMLESVRL